MILCGRKKFLNLYHPSSLIIILIDLILIFFNLKNGCKINQYFEILVKLDQIMKILRKNEFPRSDSSQNLCTRSFCVSFVHLHWIDSNWVASQH